MLIAFNKPYGVLSQFTSSNTKHRTLSEFNFPKNVYPIGRLDVDSEGLLLLSDETELNGTLLNPQHKHRRTYLVQVENIPSNDSLRKLQRGVLIKEYKTLTCRAWILDLQPILPVRNPPIRFRKNIPTCWIAIELYEGKNRQVRRMTAAIGHPTLRLIRVKIGEYYLNNIPSGKWKILSGNERKKIISK